MSFEEENTKPVVDPWWITIWYICLWIWFPIFVALFVGIYFGRMSTLGVADPQSFLTPSKYAGVVFPDDQWIVLEQKFMSTEKDKKNAPKNVLYIHAKRRDGTEDVEKTVLFRSADPP